MQGIGGGPRRRGGWKGEGAVRGGMGGGVVCTKVIDGEKA